jgi:hypothetical protein
MALIAISCNSKKETDNNEFNFIYSVIKKENDKHILYLSENINTIVNENAENKNIKVYDSLTQNYLKYISNIENGISQNTSKTFFEGDNYSPKGKEFIKKTKKYKLEIEKLIVCENFKKRFNLILNTNDVHVSEIKDKIADNNEMGKIEINRTYIKYLDYYFRGLSNYQILAFISNKKTKILELENEYLVKLKK